MIQRKPLIWHANCFVFVYSLVVPEVKTKTRWVGSGWVYKKCDTDVSCTALYRGSSLIMADYNKIQKVQLHVPSLEELRDGKVLLTETVMSGDMARFPVPRHKPIVVSVVVLQTGLEKNFAEVQVSVVECPDLTQEPFNFPVKGETLSAQLSWTVYPPNTLHHFFTSHIRFMIRIKIDKHQACRSSLFPPARA